MADTSIEWADVVWNCIRGCSLVSEGCRNCYAMRQAHRFSGKGQPYEGLTVMRGAEGSRVARWTGKVVCDESKLEDPLHWKKPRRVFVNSMSDLFHEDVPFEFIDKVFGVMFCAGQHVYQILTKRPKRMLEYMVIREKSATKWKEAITALHYATDFQGISLVPFPLRNVWLGVSVEDQKTADERIPLLLQTPAAVRWVSYEPALGPVNLSPYVMEFGDNPATGEHRTWYGLDWLVCGGESGPGARPMHPDWVRSVCAQCQDAGVPFFFKQWGEWTPGHQAPIPSARLTHVPCRTVESGDGAEVGAFRVGKKRAGRLLDGREWNEYPLTTSSVLR